MVNLFGLRTPHPKDLRKHADPVGPDNDLMIARALQTSLGQVMVAWGASGKGVEERAAKEEMP